MAKKKITMAYLQSALNLYIDALCDDDNSDMVAAGEEFIGFVNNAFNFHYDNRRFDLCKEESSNCGQFHKGMVSGIKGGVNRENA